MVRHQRLFAEFGALTSRLHLVFLLFEDPTPDYSVPAEAVEHNGEFASRRNWNALKFADEYVLKLVGVNYFFCEVSA